MLDIGAPELIIILVIVLVVFGPGHLGGAGRAIGQAIKDFRTAVKTTPEEPPAQQASVESTQTKS